jgi:hypothetical protein
MKQVIATPIFIRDFETAQELLATITDKNVPVQIFVLSHKDAIAVLDKLADRIIVQPVKRFGEEKKLYISKRPTRVSKENRQKYMPQLAGQTFTGVRKGVTLVVEIMPDGQFKRISPPSKTIYDNLSSACTSDGFRMDGWRFLKNPQGQTIDDIIKALIK